MYTVIVTCHQIIFIIPFKVTEMKFTNLILVALVVVIAGCAGNPASSLAQQCHDGLAIANKELNYAKTKGLDGTVEYTKAASLLGAAKIQSEFGKYPNCIDKVRRARAFIRMSKQ